MSYNFSEKAFLIFLEMELFKETSCISVDKLEEISYICEIQLSSPKIKKLVAICFLKRVFRIFQEGTAKPEKQKFLILQEMRFSCIFSCFP